MSINRTLILYENYVCLQFDIKAKRVNLQVEVNNSNYYHIVFLHNILYSTIYEKIHVHDCVGVAQSVRLNKKGIWSRQ